MQCCQAVLFAGFVRFIRAVLFADFVRCTFVCLGNVGVCFVLVCYDRIITNIDRCPLVLSALVIHCH